MSRRTPGRPTRQILSGAELAQTRATAGEPLAPARAPSVAFRYLIALAVLVIVAAIVWAIWGMGAATPLLLLWALGLIGSWIIL